MPLTLTVSTGSDPLGSVVVSNANATPTGKRLAMALQNTRETNLYIVDETGAYEDFSGDADASVCVSIGKRGSSLWFSTTWTPIANGWNGNISTDSDAIEALFASEGVDELDDLYLEVTVTDSAGRQLTTAQCPIKVYNRVTTSDDIAVAPSPNNTFGTIAIANGFDSGTVSGLALTATPRLVICTVRKPVGGLNLFACVVDGSITTGGFIFTLNGVADSANYHLDYYLIF